MISNPIDTKIYLAYNKEKMKSVPCMNVCTVDLPVSTLTSDLAFDSTDAVAPAVVSSLLYQLTSADTA